jgi:polar amino acid transport system substrate-binding protein
VDILEDFAETIDARIEWTHGSEEELFGAMELRELDVVVGGLTSVSPWAAQVTFTHPYITTAGVVGWPSDEPIPQDIAGKEIYVEKGGHLAGLLEKTDAIPVEVEDLAEAKDKPAAVDNWLLDDLELKDTGIRLDEADHVLAVPHGENDWLFELESYLLEHESEIEDLLAERGDL